MFNTSSLIGQSPFLSKIQSAFTQPQPRTQQGQDVRLLQPLLGKDADKSGLITKIISLFGG